MRAFKKHAMKQNRGCSMAYNGWHLKPALRGFYNGFKEIGPEQIISEVQVLYGALGGW